MPALLWRSLTAWLSARTPARGVALAEARHTGSHDRVTR